MGPPVDNHQARLLIGRNHTSAFLIGRKQPQIVSDWPEAKLEQPDKGLPPPVRSALIRHILPW